MKKLKMILGMLCILSLMGCNQVSAPIGAESTTSETQMVSMDSESSLEVHFIDVGQGDSILIESNDEYMLVDAGENNQDTVVLNYLKSEGVTKLKYVIGTHPHSDHIGGLDTVIQNFDIETVFLPNKEETTKTFTDVMNAIGSKNLEITLPIVGNEYTLGDAEFIILAPDANEDSNNNNEYSIGIKLTYGNTAFVMCGDAEADAEEKILKTGIDVKANVLKLGHHGSNTSSSQEFLNAVNPDICVISCGEGNMYNHPSRETLQKIQGKIIYRTDEEGSIVLKSDGNNILYEKEGSVNIVNEESQVQETIQNENETESIVSEEIVYKTNTGSKFHKESCDSLSSSKIEITKQEAINQGLEPCKVCKP